MIQRSNRCALLNPKLAILDEIDTGVDVDTIHALGRGINKHMQDKTKSLIIISHSEKILQEIIPTHVHILCQGKIVRSGEKEIIEKIHKDGFDRFLNEERMPGFKVLS